MSLLTITTMNSKTYIKLQTTLIALKTKLAAKNTVDNMKDELDDLKKTLQSFANQDSTQKEMWQEKVKNNVTTLEEKIRKNAAEALESINETLQVLKEKVKGGDIHEHSK